MDRFGFVGPVNGRPLNFDAFLNEVLGNEFGKEVKSPDKGSNVMNMLMGTLRTDVKETETSFIVESELPGFDKKDINVEVEDGVLTISAEKVKSDEEKSEKYLRKERYSGKFSRTFAFEGIDNEGIKAKYENGILIVELPKKQKNVVKKGIDIE